MFTSPKPLATHLFNLVSLLHVLKGKQTDPKIHSLFTVWWEDFLDFLVASFNKAKACEDLFAQDLLQNICIHPSVRPFCFHPCSLLRCGTSSSHNKHVLIYIYITMIYHVRHIGTDYFPLSLIGTHKMKFKIQSSTVQQSNRVRFLHLFGHFLKFFIEHLILWIRILILMHLLEGIVCQCISPFQTCQYHANIMPISCESCQDHRISVHRIFKQCSKNIVIDSTAFDCQV